MQDYKRYNLVVFTASWCVPCIKEIPILKKLHEELGKSMILTYVSIDNSKGVPSFLKLLKDYSIPWRTLFAYQDIKTITTKYFIEAIPYCILISPSKEMKVIDIRRETDFKELYSLM